MDGDDDRLWPTGAALNQWFSRSPADIEAERERALAAGRQAYTDAIRTGQNVVARTENDLVTLGRSRLAQQAAETARATARALQDPRNWREGLMQVDTVMRGAADVATLGADDPIAAGINTLIGQGGPGTFVQRYNRNLSQEHARDAYDAVHRPIARGLGEAVGVGLSASDGFAAAKAWSNGLSNLEKGRLGEALSRGKSWLLGDPPIGAGQPGTLSRDPIRLSNGRATIPDHVRRSGRVVEAKFGFSADLTPNQRLARRELGARYQVDRWTPNHIGYAAGAGRAGLAAADAVSDDDMP